MVNIFTRIFGYPILLDRLADKDAQIVSLKVEVQELRDRLYMKHGYTPSGDKATPAAAFPPYLTGRQRVRRMVEPNLLSVEDKQTIAESLTQ